MDGQRIRSIIFRNHYINIVNPGLKIGAVCVYSLFQAMLSTHTWTGLCVCALTCSQDFM